MNTLSPFWSRASVVLVIAGLLFFVLAPQFAVAQDPTVETAPTDVTLEAAPIVILTPAATAIQVTAIPTPDTGSGVVLVPAAEVPAIVYVALGVIVAVLVVALIYQNQLIKLVAGLVDPETARELVQSGISMGGEFALGLAKQTSTELDEKAIAKFYAARGYKVTMLADGSSHIEPPSLVPVPTPATPPTEVNVNINNNGGAPEGSVPTVEKDPFHPEG